MSERKIHPKSPLGQVASLRATFEARKNEADALVQKRTDELAEIRADIKLVPMDTDDVATLAKLQAQERAIWTLLERAEEEAARAGQELARFAEGAALLESRLHRLQDGIATLEDEAKFVAGSPVERRESLAVASYKLAVLIDDPRKAAKRLEDLPSQVDPGRWRNRVWPSLVSYEKNTRTIAGLPEMAG
jgi:chromosome segregation ATPase